MTIAIACLTSALLFEVISQCYERGSIIITSSLPFDECTEVFGSERLTGALLDRLTHHVHILEMNGESYRLKHSRNKRLPTTSLTGNGDRIFLDPSIERCMINIDAALGHDFFEIPI